MHSSSNPGSNLRFTSIYASPLLRNRGGILFSSSPTNFLFWWACRISFERSLRVHFEIVSVCLYHDLHANSWTLFLTFYPKCFMLFISGFISASLTN